MVIIASLEKASEEVMFKSRPNQVIHEGGKVVRNRDCRGHSSLAQAKALDLGRT